MINDVGKFVVYEACRQLQQWHNLGYPNICMSINISESQIDGEEFLDFVKVVLNKTGVETKFLIFEITERIVIGLDEKKLKLIEKLKDMGIRIFIDDFGTKYSNLDYLNAMPVDGIKIDKSFIDKLENSQKDLMITKSVVKLAHELKLEVIAEGVEDQKQLKCLLNMKCSKIQGFIFEKPIPPNEVCKFMTNFKA
ncbi:EAL domain-containing protein [Clostridium sp. DMHC 10]|uniref:EAL domain-containing protein n=2 Tax=Clostridium TaxID=1485 RepID=UPI00069D9E80|nr:EAL domain-containing protein [Clostridium sp. DMHC 10]